MKMRSFQYPCPDCRSTNNLHDSDCTYSETPRERIEAAYFDILNNVSFTVKTKDEIKRSVNGSWIALYDDCLTLLKQSYVIAESSNGEYTVLGEDERKDAITEPQYDPLKTIYEQGSVDGCHDNAVFALIAFYEFAGLSWEETREKTVDWLLESGTWDRDGIDERSPEELVKKKRHVYESGYGWKDKAESAKRIIDREMT